MKIAIDFDGTIARREGIPTRPQKVSKLKQMEGALDAIKYLLDLKHEVYVCTSNDVFEVEQWLNKMNFPSLRVSNAKLPGTHMYIDDRALRFTNWQDIRKYFG